MRHFDGSQRWDVIERQLQAAGYALNFACTYGVRQPDDFDFDGKESGWEMRRKLKAWCKSHGISDFQIVRNTSYHADLHGRRVYELWTRRGA